MRSIFTTLSLASVLLATPSVAQNKIAYQEYDLPNGLHVILHEDHSTPIVAVTIMYHVGSKNENPERTGFAHFFEHLLFEGSENIKRGEFDTYIESSGGTLNANTTNDRTFYHEILPSNFLEMGLWLESERLMHAKVEKIGIETQREVVKEERRQSVDNRPYGSILEETMKRVYTKHPYRWSVIGSMDHLNAATDEEFVDFYKTFYVPNNAVLSIAGDIDMAQAKKWIEMYFSDIPKGTREIPRPTIVEPKQQAEIRDTVYDNIQLPAVIHAYKIPGQGTQEYYAMEMLTTLLSRGQSSRLYRRLIDEEQKALQVGAIPLGLEDPGVALAYGIANAGVDAADVEASMEAEYEKVKTELITKEEFQKIRNQIENDFVSGNSTVAGIAESLANYHMYFGDAELINTEISRYMDVTREDIMAVAKKYLTKENRVVLYYLAKSKEGQQ